MLRIMNIEMELLLQKGENMRIKGFVSNYSFLFRRRSNELPQTFCLCYTYTYQSYFLLIYCPNFYQDVASILLLILPCYFHLNAQILSTFCYHTAIINLIMNINLPIKY